MKQEDILPGSQGEHSLQKKYKTQDKAKDFYQRQMLSSLSVSMQDFIKEQEMVFISTADAKGECDSSFRSGEKGFVLVLDENNLAYAEYKGNGVMASMGNISENPHIGMLFLDVLKDKVGLHVNGKARVLSGEDLHSCLSNSSYEKIEVYDKGLPNKEVAWVLIEVEEAYIHCSKNIPLFQKNDKKEEWNKARPIDYFNLGN